MGEPEPAPRRQLSIRPAGESQTLRRDAALVSRPKEQATRPRVLLWVNMRQTGMFASRPGSPQ